MSDTPVLQRIHDVAQPQGGCISTKQLGELAIHEDAIRSLEVRGGLRRIVRGVYVVGSRSLTDHQLLWTAVLAAGPNSAISHWSAAALHGFADPPRGEVWVTTPGRRGERTLVTEIPAQTTGQAATIHIVSARIDKNEIVTLLVQGIRTVEPALAIVKFATQCEDDVLMRAWGEADYRNKLRESDSDRILGRGVSGTAAVRSVMRRQPIVSDDETRVATEGEFLLLRAVLTIGLPRPLTNAALRLPGRTYDPDQYHVDVRLVVEVDGGVHRRPARKRSDALRDAHMRSHGYAVLRIPDFDVEADAIACAHRVADERKRLLNRAASA